MELFDTHVHFSKAAGDYTIEHQVARAREAGVVEMVAVGGSDELNAAACVAGGKFPDMISVALGWDRDCATEFSTQEAVDGAVERLRKMIAAAADEPWRVSAIGEIGLDYHYSAETADAQRELFRAQLSLANSLGLPVVVHSREADDDTLEILRQHAKAWRGDTRRIGVLHCFTGNAEFASQLVELGFYISFSGIVTFLNANPLRSVAAEIPADRILVETDSPYLAPMPMRGKRNEPSFVAHVARRLAEVRGMEIDDLAALTSANARDLFGVQSK